MLTLRNLGLVVRFDGRQRDDAIGTRSLHAEKSASDDLDTLRRFVARRFDLQNALDLAKTSLLCVRASELVSERERFSAKREMQRERAHCGGDGERPHGDEGARPANSLSHGSPGIDARLDARSFALRARGFAAISSSLGAMNFFQTGTQELRSENACFTGLSSKE